MFPKYFLSFYSTFKSEGNANTHESEQQDSVDQEIETEIKAFLAEENLSAKLKSCLGGIQTKKNTHILPGLQEGIFRHHHLLFILKWLFSAAGNLYEQMRNRLLPKTGEKLLFPHHSFK